ISTGLSIGLKFGRLFGASIRRETTPAGSSAIASSRNIPVGVCGTRHQPMAPNDSREFSAAFWDDEVRRNRISIGARIRDVLDGQSVPNLNRDLLDIQGSSPVVGEVCEIVRTGGLRENSAGKLESPDNQS